MAKKTLSILCLILVLCVGVTVVGCHKQQIKTGEGTVTSKEDAIQPPQGDQQKKEGEERPTKTTEDIARRRQEDLRRAEEARKAEETRRAEEARRAEETRRTEEERKAEEARRKAEEAGKREFVASLEPKKEPAGIGEKAYTSPLLRDVHFDFDKYDIRPADADILRENAAILMQNPTVKIQVEGHCDERGTAEYNLALGERRANSVKKYLVSLGVPADRLSTISYGKELPLDPGHDEGAWTKNRRGHLTVLSK